MKTQIETSDPAILIAMAKIRAGSKSAYENYVSSATPILISHGAQPMGRYSVTDVLMDSPDVETIFMAEFPSADAIRNALSDPNYKALLPIRDQAFEALHLMIIKAVPA